MDATGRLIVSNPSVPSITIYNGATATGNAAPVATITGATTGLVSPDQLVFDNTSGGTLYVADSGAAKIAIFTNFNTANGDVAPARSIVGASTTLSTTSASSGIALDTTR